MGINITLPDGSKRELSEGASAYDLAADIGPGLAKATLACVIKNDALDNVVKDFNYVLQEGDTVRLLTKRDPESLEVLRHTTAHILAQAIQGLYPSAKIAIGPAIENGFYYDFEIPEHQLTPDDFEKIEAKMTEIAQAGQRMVRRGVAPKDVEGLITKIQNDGEKFKAEILDKYRDDPTLYYCVDKENNDVWFDVCEGPHVPDTSWLKPKSFKLLSVAGAYWRGDENREQLQRLYATAFWDKKDLAAYLTLQEEADKRDHRKLAKTLDLFSFKDEIGPGLVLWHPNLSTVREEIENHLRKRLRREGYDSVYTPHLAKKDLWDISGHTSHYLENMFTMDIEDQPYILKPMNCPLHTMIFKSSLHSYRELPIRIAEFGTVYRYEKSGVVHGLFRARGFTQDDAHIFCRPDQVKSEILDLIKFTDELFKVFGMEFAQVELSTRPAKYVGDIEKWALAESALKEALDAYGLPYEINEGDGAFYGPKIDFKIKDSLGRSWQCSTIQLDFNLPERFELGYKDSDGQDKQPIMIHRAILGSMERFMGILIEHYAGAFPTWLAPTQVRFLPIADRHVAQCEGFSNQLADEGVRVKVDDSSETIGNKIRRAQLDKIPYMLVVGDQEIESQQVAIRSRSRGDLGTLPFDNFTEQLHREIVSHGTKEVEVMGATEKVRS